MYIFFQKFAQHFGLKQTLAFKAYKKNEDKTKGSLQIRVWKNENKNNRLLLV